MATRYKGKTGKVVYAGTVLCVKSWKGKHVVDGMDVTDTCSGGKREFEDGLEHFEFTIEAEWKSGQHPFGTTPSNLKAGQTPEVMLYVNAADAYPTVDMPYAFIEGVDIDVPVDGTVKYTISGKSSGAFTLNGN